MSRPLARHCWSLSELSPGDAERLLADARWMRQACDAGKRLRGCHVAVLTETPGGPSAQLFTGAAEALGASVVHLSPRAARLGDAGEARQTARALGRLYAAILCDGFSRPQVVQFARWAGVPVFDSVADELHPTRMLGDALTIADNADKPLPQNTVCVEGEATDPLPQAWQRMGALIGLQVHACEGGRCGTGHKGDFLSGMPRSGEAAAGLWEVDPASGALQSLHLQQAENHRLVVQALLAKTLARA
jgi:ornithine carbamoyltransferase